MKNIGAFFDIDGTLYREGLITEIFKKLIKSEIISEDRWFNDVRDNYVKWDKRQGNYDDYLLKMADIYTDAIRGKHRSHIEFIAKKVIEQKGDRVYTFTRDRIAWHKAQGHQVVTISGSPIELVREMSMKHGFHDHLGSIYHLDDNDTYTGDVAPMWDAVNKDKAVQRMVDKYNLDLSQSYAYGDTAGDFSMLQLVGNPVAINPTKELLTKIKACDETRKKVQVVVERKDMVYHLSPEQIQV